MMALQIPPDCDLCSCNRCSSSSGTTSSTAREVFSGNGEPNSIGFLPDDILHSALYYDLDTGVMYQWDVGEQTWK